jgi:succinate dehydrogenase/fumarate reductase cytochrome b subunit
MSDMVLIRIQAAAGSVFLIFTVFHLANTVAASVGMEEYNRFQRSVRAVYQHPLVEIGGLALPLLVHLGATTVRWRRRGLRWSAKSVRSRLHTVTGLYLLAVIGGHVVATRGPSLLDNYHPEFAGLSFSLWWLPLLFYPYYTLFALSALYHGTNGLLLAAAAFSKPLPVSLRRGPGYWVPISTIAVLIFVGILGLGGLLYEIPDPTDNDYARMWKGFGVSLER